ncbi:MAG: hypothetical protein ABGZ53_01435, partial [Fuerstiella sp.]
MAGLIAFQFKDELRVVLQSDSPRAGSEFDDTDNKELQSATSVQHESDGGDIVEQDHGHPKTVKVGSGLKRESADAKAIQPPARDRESVESREHEGKEPARDEVHLDKASDPIEFAIQGLRLATSWKDDGIGKHNLAELIRDTALLKVRLRDEPGAFLLLDLLEEVPGIRSYQQEEWRLRAHSAIAAMYADGDDPQRAKKIILDIGNAIRLQPLARSYVAYVRNDDPYRAKESLAEMRQIFVKIQHPDDAVLEYYQPTEAAQDIIIAHIDAGDVDAALQLAMQIAEIPWPDVDDFRGRATTPRLTPATVIKFA